MGETGKKLNVKFFVSMHKPSAMPDLPMIYPIQVGAALAKKRFEGVLHDDEGTDQISKLNKSYCEMTAQYWAWKNADADYYGFCHYRRYLSFSDERYVDDVYGNVLFPYVTTDVIQKKLGYTQENIEKKIAGYDIIYTEPWNTNSVQLPNLWKQYDAVGHLYRKDLDIMMDVINDLYPEYASTAMEHMDGSILFPCNMYVMRKEVFFDYCKWIFSIMEEVEKRLDMKNYCVESVRVTGHLAERLFGIYIMHHRKTNDYRVKVVQRVCFNDTEPCEIVTPPKKENVVPVVLICDDKFAMYAAVTLKSILLHADKNRYYDIVFMFSNLSEKNRDVLRQIAAEYKNAQLRFRKISSMVSDLQLLSHEHISVDTFYRFAIPELFVGYDKVVYIDTDAVANDDVGKLYDTEMGDNLVAAVRDIDNAGQTNGAIPEMKDYWSRVLKLDSPFNYFQAGVLVFNLKEMKKTFKPFELFEFSNGKNFKYADQDVLNIMCRGRVKYLDMSWNVIHDCNNERIKNIISYAPASMANEYMESRKHVRIAHYAGFAKPWRTPYEDMAYYFWNVARTIPMVYERLIYDMCHQEKVVYAQEQPWVPTPVVEEHIPMQGLVKSNLLNRLFPKGSGRREALLKVYKKVFHR